MSLPFLKMHGAGNDFVILDARRDPVRLTSPQVRSIAARDNPATEGCDQVIVMESPPAPFPYEDNEKQADVFMRIYNADGGEVDACGNATRCVGWLIMEEKGSGDAAIQTNAGLLHCAKNHWGSGNQGWASASGLVTADMGMPRFGWEDIPLSQPLDTGQLPLRIEEFSDASAVSMGNPHVVFFVSEVEQLQRIEKIGAQLQKHPLFPKGVNVSIAYVSGNPLSGTVLMRVWERGVGLTASCGTAACAVKVCAVRRGLLAGEKYHTLLLQNADDMQSLMVRWDENSGHVFLHGPVELEFRDELEFPHLLRDPAQ